MEKDYMLTTIDNPYDPFEQFNLWFMFDVEKGYNTCGKIARIAVITDEMSEKEIEIETKRAIDTIIKEDFLDLYKRAYEIQTGE